MSNKFNKFCAQAKDPVIILGMTIIACLLFFKSCGNGKKGYSDRELLQEIATNVETIKQDAGDVKADTKHIRRVVNKTHSTVTKTAAKVQNIETIVTRTEKKVDAVQETADSILTKVEECCGCNCEKNKMAKIPNAKLVVVPSVDTASKPKPKPVVVVVDTVSDKPDPVVVKPDTVPVAPVKKDTILARVVCTEYWIYR